LVQDFAALFARHGGIPVVINNGYVMSNKDIVQERMLKHTVSKISLALQSHHAAGVDKLSLRLKPAQQVIIVADFVLQISNKKME
jgi:hypothetical protein